jgi:ubiquinone/menaquinone biosynthesis C-methylase UbiE
MAGTAARYDQIADFYDATAGKTVTDPATAALLDLAGDVSGLRLLDVACGQARVARELARRGAQLTGLDISAALLAKAQAHEAAERLGISYLHADATDPMVLAGLAFDGAVCNYGLSDVDDLDGLGSQAKPCLSMSRCARAGVGGPPCASSPPIDSPSSSPKAAM